jgi:Pentapeptide repeats (8 copies)
MANASTSARVADVSRASLHTAVVAIWLVSVGLVIVVGVLAGLPFVPISRRWTKWASRAAFWSRDSVRLRLQRRRSLLLVYAGLAVAGALVFAVWVLPSILTEHPHIPKSADRHKAITDTRTGLVAVLAAIGAAGGLAYTARTYRLGQETYRLAREGQITDRFSKAVEQLGNEKIEVRLGGIYALERLMRDSPADQRTIMETLAAFVRLHAPAKNRPAVPTGVASPSGADERPGQDVQAILTVLGRRHPQVGDPQLDLSNTELTRADLPGAYFRGARLEGAILIHAFLPDADLHNAFLSDADLSFAFLSRTDLTDADLFNAKLVRARLEGADLTLADLSKADVTNAILKGATLTRSSLSEAQLASAQGTDAINWK